MAVLPDVPTMKEAGFEGIGTNAWQALFAPKNVPKDVLAIVAKAIHEVLTSEKAIKQLEELQFTLIPTRTAEEALAWHRKEQEHWRPIVAEAKAMVQKTQ
jgi:tripartite-type tricarboxylate transporter receptor subunit TctC